MEGPLGAQPAGGRLSVKNSLCDIAHGYKKRPHVFKFQAYNGAECLVQAQSDKDMLDWIRVIHEQSNPDNDTTPAHELIKRKAQQQQFSRRTSSQFTPSVPKLPSVDVDPCDEKNASASNAGTANAAATAASAATASPHNFRFSRLPHNFNLLRRFTREHSSVSYSINPFATSLEDQCKDCKSDVPMALRKLTEEIERRGLDEEGLYRISGSTSQVDAICEGLKKEGEYLDLSDVKK